jgi:acetyl-CoA carboxylase biotin carboxylase subunit
MSFSREFVANRGEIALRIVRACRKLGLESVLGASEVDLEGPAARLADRVVCIGPAPAERSLEHPVTEAVTGYDLVAKQLEIAAGEPLGTAQPGMAIAGHAVECRLTAENVSEGFRPSPGTLTRFEVPDVANLRVDTHYEEGTVIPPHYDSLMAKLIGIGAERDAAVDVVREALDGLRAEGVETNRELLASVLAHGDFARGAVTTRWLEEAVAA